MLKAANYGIFRRLSVLFALGLQEILYLLRAFALKLCKYVSSVEKRGNDIFGLYCYYHATNLWSYTKRFFFFLFSHLNEVSNVCLLLFPIHQIEGNPYLYQFSRNEK